MADSIVIGIAAVAEHFNRSERQVRRWMRDGMPRLSQNRFDVLQIAAWLDEKKAIRPVAGSGWVDPRQRGLGEVASGGKDYHDERLKKAKADRAEIEVKQLRAELVPKTEIYQLFAARAGATKQNLLTMGRSLPPQLIHCKSEREMEIIIMAAIREFLEAFSRKLPDALGGVAAPTEVED